MKVRTGVVAPTRVGYIYPAIERYADEPAWPRVVLALMLLAGAAAMLLGWP